MRGGAVRIGSNDQERHRKQRQLVRLRRRRTTFSSVSGSWVEPEANCSSGQGYSSYWVGLGGASGQSQALEQTRHRDGLQRLRLGAATTRGTSSCQPVPVNLDLDISAGDHMTGKVTVSGSNVTISLSDETDR